MRSSFQDSRTDAVRKVWKRYWFFRKLGYFHVVARKIYKNYDIRFKLEYVFFCNFQVLKDSGEIDENLPETKKVNFTKRKK